MTAINSTKEVIAETLRNMPGIRRTDRGLAAGLKSMSIITFADGATDRAWGHINGRQASNLARKRRKQIAVVAHVIADRDGHGNAVDTIGSFGLAGLTLREIA